ncbi:hypothetical protein D3C78_18780 [compost metagenome]
MIEYRLTTRNRGGELVSDIVYSGGKPLEYTYNGDYMLHFDEDLIRNRTIGVKEQEHTNVFFVLLLLTKEVRVGFIYEAESIGHLAQLVYDHPAISSAEILFAARLTDGKTSLVMSDDFSAESPASCGYIGPIANDKALISDLKKFLELLWLLHNGKYPSNGHLIIDHLGGLQPWYPMGGLKGHKKKLIAAGYNFIEEYTVGQS